MPYKRSYASRYAQNKRRSTRGGFGAMLYGNRYLYGMRAPNPRPYQPRTSINKYENKALTGANASSLCRQEGQVYHLDQIERGNQLGQALGQKHMVTAIHLRGTWKLPNNENYDRPGYYLVWDRQPNEALATPGDILDLTVGGADCSVAFPNQDNGSRFIIIAKRESKAANTNVNDDQYDPSMVWDVDEYHRLPRNLVATKTLGSASGLIDNRVTGALLLLTFGKNTSVNSNPLEFQFRVYFQDV